MGRDKALLPWPPAASGNDDQTFLSSWIRELGPFNDMVIVVAGQNYENLAPVAFGNGAFIVRNPHPEKGQFSSLRVGLQDVLNRGRDAAMITLVDRPPVSAATLQTLQSAFAAAIVREKWAVVPSFRDKHGHPVIAGREMIEAFLKAPADAAARDIEHQHEGKIEYVPVEDWAIAVNVNTPEDYANLISASKTDR
jgi:CTP:molybdopterin cytidylyltransferase MocA